MAAHSRAGDIIARALTARLTVAGRVLESPSSLRIAVLPRREPVGRSERCRGARWRLTGLRKACQNPISLLIAGQPLFRSAAL